jgi:hypothetical protein
VFVERLHGGEAVELRGDDAQSSVSGKYVFVAKTSTLPGYQDFLHLSDAAELSLGAAFGKLSRSHV